MLSLLLLSSAYAASSPDLTTSITAPAGTYVYQSARWQATVSNSGNRDASSTVLTIELPKTHTSPGVYVMGTLGAKSASCVASGTKLTCSVGTVRRGTSTTVYFDLTLPESTDSLAFSATATTTTAEPNRANNGSTATAALLNYSPSFVGSVDVDNRHCTGTALTSFFECELFPSSISSHVVTLNSDNTISIAGAPDYGGTWAVVGDELSFNYTELGTIVAEFVGYGVDATGCWEGLTTFPGSIYVSPYEVCVQ